MTLEPVGTLQGQKAALWFAGIGAEVGAGDTDWKRGMKELSWKIEMFFILTGW